MGFVGQSVSLITRPDSRPSGIAVVKKDRLGGGDVNGAKGKSVGEQLFF